MSEIQRWEVRWNRVMQPQPDGEFIRYADHRAVLAEIEERLQAYSDRLRADPTWPEEAADAIELAANAALGEQHDD